MIPHCLHNLLTDGGDVDLTHGPLSASGTNFSWRLTQIPGPRAAGKYT
jgi:hypothetical protein